MNRMIEIYMIKGAIGCPDKVVCGRTVSSDRPDWINTPAIYSTVKDIIDSTMPAANTPYHRICGPFEDGTYYIDFGSYTYFIWFGLKEDFDSRIKKFSNE